MPNVKKNHFEYIYEETKKFPILDYLQSFLKAWEEHLYILHTS